MNKELFKTADIWFQTSPHSIQAPVSAFLAGAKEILDNPELYDLVTRDTYIKRFRLEESGEDLRKENKELKEKITELETVIAKLSQKVITNKSNY